MVFNKRTPKWWENMFEGNTDRQLPLVKPLTKGSSTILVGFPGKMGCFSARRLEWDTRMVDVAIYREAPEAVAKAVSTGQPTGARYIDVSYKPGWGYRALAETNR